MYSHHLSATEAGLARAARLQTRTTNRRVEADAHPPTTLLVLRAAVPEDRHALARMLSELSPRSSFLRFFAGGFPESPTGSWNRCCVSALPAGRSSRSRGIAWSPTRCGRPRVPMTAGRRSRSSVRSHGPAPARSGHAPDPPRARGCLRERVH